MAVYWLGQRNSHGPLWLIMWRGQIQNLCLLESFVFEKFSLHLVSHLKTLGGYNFVLRVYDRRLLVRFAQAKEIYMKL